MGKEILVLDFGDTKYKDNISIVFLEKDFALSVDKNLHNYLKEIQIINNLYLIYIHVNIAFSKYY